ncbi:MAG: 1,4-alpha-glucan branching protein GlgB [Colwellia sp.]|nr:1,4-alpha-glucan branching protein GlgB [Colwellia sp.]
MTDTMLMADKTKQGEVNIPAHIGDYSTQVAAFEQAEFADPYAFLGIHDYNAVAVILRVYIPGAEQVFYQSEQQKIAYQRYKNSALFTLVLKKKDLQKNYQLSIVYPLSTVQEIDSYSLPSTFDEQAMYLFGEGALAHAHHHLGAQWQKQHNTNGVRFTLWAPNAQCVSVIGDFNHWNATRHLMRKHPGSGIWEIFISNVHAGQSYKFSLLSQDGQRLEKADPFAFVMQMSPSTASVIAEQEFTIQLPSKYQQSRANKVQERLLRNSIDRPISIYEVHAGSWQRHPEKVAEGESGYLSYQELAEKLVPYVKSMGFTHIQLMPISEFPFDGSWGYQPVGLFAPTCRFGGIADFQQLVDTCQQQNIGLLVDWVPGHFPSDAHGLAKFDGTHLFEHADKRQGFHPDWQTHIYNYERGEVKSFLISNAMYWFDRFDIDGLRVDAVASMLYLDYSREEGQWLANEYGGRENLAAIELLKQVNLRCYQENPGIMMTAEESTAWPGVTKYTEHGGLGFGYKWNMGWMNDSLNYMTCDPLYRCHHHNEMTFSLMYAYSENFILPLSHDEVVHGKRSLLNKMPGDDWQKFANLRAYFAFMWAHPGKKLLFMGGEFAQRNEWNHDQSLDWDLLEKNEHQGVQVLIKELNELYCQSPALFELDNKASGFQWLDQSNAQQSIFSFIRFAKDLNEHVVVVSNMTPNPLKEYRVGVPSSYDYRVIFDSDSDKYAGSGFNQQHILGNDSIPWQGVEHSVCIELPPLATVYLVKVK